MFCGWDGLLVCVGDCCCSWLFGVLFCFYGCCGGLFLESSLPICCYFCVRLFVVCLFVCLRFSCCILLCCYLVSFYGLCWWCLVGLIDCACYGCLLFVVVIRVGWLWIGWLGGCSLLFYNSIADIYFVLVFLFGCLFNFCLLSCCVVVVVCVLVCVFWIIMLVFMVWHGSCCFGVLLNSVVHSAVIYPV